MSTTIRTMCPMNCFPTLCGMLTEVEEGRRLILGAFAEGELVGTVQVILALPPNQPHRAEIAKLLVHRSARRRGIRDCRSK